MSFRAQTYLSVVSFIHFVEIMPIHDDQDIDDERVGSWEAVAENNKPAVGRFHSQVLLIVTKIKYHENDSNVNNVNDVNTQMMEDRDRRDHLSGIITIIVVKINKCLKNEWKR